MTTQQRRPPAFTRNINKVAAKVAGYRILPLWALVRHRGRKSSTPYQTPIAVIGSTTHLVYIGLPWGRHTDWVRNLRANGGTLVWKGQTCTVTELAFVDKAEALAQMPRLRRGVVRRWALNDYLRLTLQRPS